MPESGKVRYEFVDLAKGICIILVVFLHLCGDIQGQTGIMIRSFRMPLYFILSGMFFSRYGGFVDFGIKKINRLLIPFLFFWIVPCLLMVLKNTLCGETRDWTWIRAPYIEDIGLNLPIWFLLCLFSCGLMFYSIVLLSDKFEGNDVFRVSVFAALVGATGFVLGKNDINIPFWIDSAMTAVPFYAFGYILRKHTGFFQKKLPIWLMLAISVLMLTFSFLFSSYSELMNNGMFDSSFISFYSCGIAGTMAVLFISKAINRIPVISYLGRYSICILVTHFLIRNVFLIPLCSTVAAQFELPLGSVRVITTVLLLLLYLLIIPLMKAIIPWFCAQKDLILYSIEKQS